MELVMAVGHNISTLAANPATKNGGTPPAPLLKSEAEKHTGLSSSQLAVYEFIGIFALEQRRVPTYVEIASALGYRSTATIFKHVAALARAGLIRKNKSNGSIAIVRGKCPLCHAHRKAEVRKEARA
jgi:SOS-response transcriptional repressor LexA